MTVHEAGSGAHDALIEAEGDPTLGKAWKSGSSGLAWAGEIARELLPARPGGDP